MKLRSFVRDNLYAGRSSPFLRLFIPAFVLLLPLLALGGSVTNASAPLPQKSPDQPQTLVLRVYFHDNAERDRLATQLNAEEAATTGGYLTVFADQSLYQSILSQGIRAEIDQAETKAFNSIKWGADTFYGGFKTVEEEGTYLNQMAATYPTLAQVVDIGDSWCKVHTGTCTLPAPYNGYDILALHITNQAIAGPKPVYWFEAGIHAREIAAPEIAMHYISYLLDGYNSDPDAHWLVDYQDIWVIPMLNPDGHHIVEAGGGGDSPYYQRKNSNNTNGCTTWPPDAFTQFGTDNNRNFPFMWNCCGGSSSAPCDQTYHGTGGASDPETQATVNQVRLLIPDQRGPNITDPAPITATGVIMDMHSNASLNLYPWGFTTTASPNGAEFNVIGAHMQHTNANPPGNNYQSCQPPNCLYAVDGDGLDWGYGELGAASFTTEVGGNDFFVPLSYVDNTLWPANKGALIYEAKVARTPFLLAHGPDAYNVATTPMTVTQGLTTTLSGTINFAWTGNTFSQNVGAAEYYIDTPPWAGGTAIPMSGNFTSPTVPVQATIDTSSLTVGRHIIFVRGRGANDYQGFQTWGEAAAAWLWVMPNGGATATPTNTTVPPTSTHTPAPTDTATVPAPTGTAPEPTVTAPAATDTPSVPTTTETATAPPAVTETPTTCNLTFIDVPPNSTFYQWIHCLICLGIVNGYPDGTFKPGNPVTRGQLSKIVANSAGFDDTPTGQQFQDVPASGPGSTFYVYLYRLVHRGYISGYPCGTPPAGACVPPANLPYFLPNSNASRGQISKIVSNAAGFNDPPSGQQFQDVAVGSTFYPYIYRLSTRGIINGYQCGTLPQEPCVPPANLPYFRPNANATRGQMSKIDAADFFPDCSPQSGRPAGK